MKTTNIAVGIVAVIGVVLGVVNFGKPITVSVSPTPVEVNVPAQEAPVINIPAQKAPIVNVSAPTQEPSSNILGAVSGPFVFYRTFFNSGLTVGGRVATTSTATTYTTNARDFNDTPTVVQWTPNINTTVSISATSTFGYIPKVGDVANIYLRNASSTPTSSITLAAVDSGVDLQTNESGGDLVLNGLDWVKLTLIRTATNTVTVIFDEFIEAD
jgi:hypothetical protein